MHLDRRGVALVLVLAALFVTTRASAHGQRIARIELVERTAERGELTVELSVPEPSLGFAVDGCTVTEVGGHPEALERRFTIACGPTNDARALHVQGLGPIIDRAVVHTKLTSGTDATALLSPDSPTLTLSAPNSTSRLFMRYFRLGIRHIASGPDHLVFLLLLVLSLRRLRAVLLAETAFTVSHTFSYAATALGWVHVASAPTEVCIALSLLLLGADVSIETPMPVVRGAATAFVFGFVHGLGFAGGLQEVGVDARAAGFAVLSFGGGVEAAQISAVLIGFIVVSQAARSRVWPMIAEGLVLSGGSASVYWLLERGVAMLSG